MYPTQNQDNQTPNEQAQSVNSPLYKGYSLIIFKDKIEISGEEISLDNISNIKFSGWLYSLLGMGAEYGMKKITLSLKDGKHKRIYLPLDDYFAFKSYYENGSVDNQLVKSANNIIGFWIAGAIIVLALCALLAYYLSNNN